MCQTAQEDIISAAGSIDITQNRKWLDAKKCHFRTVAPKHYTTQQSPLAKIGMNSFLKLKKPN